MKKQKQVIDLRQKGWSYRKISKKVGLCPRSVILIWWKSHLTEKELREYHNQVNTLAREKYRLLRKAVEKKGITSTSRPRKQ